MLREKVGTVMEEEKNRVLGLHERKLGLEELAASLGNPLAAQEVKDELYEKIIRDMGETKIKLQDWWNEMYEKYGWKRAEGGVWNINFQTNEIFLDNIKDE